MAIFTRQSLRLGPAIVPTEPVEVELDHPLIEGAEAFWLFNGLFPRNLIPGKSGKLSGGAPIKPGAIGPATRIDGASPGITTDLALPTLPQISVIVIAASRASTNGTWFTSTGGNGRLAANSHNDYNTDKGFELIANSATVSGKPAGNQSPQTLELSLTTNSAPHIASIPFSGFDEKATQAFAGTYDGQYMRAGIGGKFGTPYSTSGIVNGGAPANVAFGYNPVYNGDYANGDFYSGIILPRGISTGDFEWINAEPFAMLRPLVRRQYYVAASAVAPGTTRQPVIWFGM